MGKHKAVSSGPLENGDKIWWSQRHFSSFPVLIAVILMEPLLPGPVISGIIIKPWSWEVHKGSLFPSLPLMLIGAISAKGVARWCLNSSCDQRLPPSRSSLFHLWAAQPLSIFFLKMEPKWIPCSCDPFRLIYPWGLNTVHQKPFCAR